MNPTTANRRSNSFTSFAMIAVVTRDYSDRNAANGRHASPTRRQKARQHVQDEQGERCDRESWRPFEDLVLRVGYRARRRRTKSREHREATSSW
jgi:hypothetical protein